ncbi:helix-turn-helix transcriptional regulator [Staphylococcus gallinarum]|jgi:DNA-binding XRE family transcriptional regulator|uniref:XRE family transcriptional regulator n=1 Tax=Staphylococcus gallinarum TaxID=1293 RepID=A0A2T4SWJ5_STAGA|nr:helix-turn-helix transcriptional regulator [Staphylococcus gallinarum]HIW39051.1 helix-turn-helix transcriptional regulator [Candidatus Jeotgalicoccus stercoravium]MCD8843618.1 helix-turn-helix transcriptional regulator [Staphylococcus gallinarum]MCD8872089.1 helix-turn-helix transcriptional regulator [Staphylococcus gallinarum]MCQ9288765.1 helix-turn-helix transcriptional regulator [Staphylococcus gallinarum]MDN6413712.1 helix-turn-helix transcriptional regulator [Staphylococcus gallinarum
MTKLSIKALRINKEMNQQDVADILGVSKPTVIKWEKGDVEPKGLVIYALAKLYEVEIENIDIRQKNLPLD